MTVWGVDRAGRSDLLSDFRLHRSFPERFRRECVLSHPLSRSGLGRYWPDRM